MSKFHPNSGNLTRTSSSGSIPTSNPNQGGMCDGGLSDDDDSDGARGVGSQGSSALSYKERRREAHTQAEQKRRDAIKKGYDYLQDLVPTCSGASQSGTSGSSGAGGAGDEGPTTSSAKISKALVLQKSIEYIQFVQQQKKKQEEDLGLLRKEVVALEIMRKNYEQLVKSHTARSNAAAAAMGSERTGHDDSYVPVEIKFQVFQLLMDSLFRSFNDNVGMNNFSELSGCVFSWLEEQCKPQLLQELMLNILQQVKTDYVKEQQDEDTQNGVAFGGAGPSGNRPQQMQ